MSSFANSELPRGRSSKDLEKVEELELAMSEHPSSNTGHWRGRTRGRRSAGQRREKPPLVSTSTAMKTRRSASAQGSTTKDSHFIAASDNLSGAENELSGNAEIGQNPSEQADHTVETDYRPLVSGGNSKSQESRSQSPTESVAENTCSSSGSVSVVTGASNSKASSDSERTAAPAPYPHAALQCRSCSAEINEPIVFQVDGSGWHRGCLRCSVCCGELYVGNKLYYRGERLYCQDDYKRLFLDACTCVGCGESLSPQDIVFTLSTRSGHDDYALFHPACVKCATCRRQLVRGDEYALHRRRLYCKPHYEQISLTNGRSSPSGIKGSPYNNHGNHGSDDDVKQSNMANSTAGRRGRGKGRGRGRGRNYVVMGQGRRYYSRSQLNDDQRNVLMKVFVKTEKPSLETRRQLAGTVGLDCQQVTVWFQNQRAKVRRQQEQAAAGLSEAHGASQADYENISPTVEQQLLLGQGDIERDEDSVEIERGDNAEGEDAVDDGDDDDGGLVIDMDIITSPVAAEPVTSSVAAEPAKSTEVVATKRTARDENLVTPLAKRHFEEEVSSPKMTAPSSPSKSLPGQKKIDRFEQQKKNKGRPVLPLSINGHQAEENGRPEVSSQPASLTSSPVVPKWSDWPESAKELVSSPAESNDVLPDKNIAFGELRRSLSKGSVASRPSSVPLAAQPQEIAELQRGKDGGSSSPILHNSLEPKDKPPGKTSHRPKSSMPVSTFSTSTILSPPESSSPHDVPFQGRLAAASPANYPPPRPTASVLTMTPVHSPKLSSSQARPMTSLSSELPYPSSWTNSMYGYNMLGASSTATPRLTTGVMAYSTSDAPHGVLPVEYNSYYQAAVLPQQSVIGTSQVPPYVVAPYNVSHDYAMSRSDLPSNPGVSVQSFITQAPWYPPVQQTGEFLSADNSAGRAAHLATL